MKYLKKFESFYTQIGDDHSIESITGKKNPIPTMISDKVINLLSKYNPSINNVGGDIHGGYYPSDFSYIMIYPTDVGFLDKYKGYVYLNCRVNIVEHEDEWFRISVFIQYKKDHRHSVENEVINYLCDQYDGLVEFLEHNRFDLVL
jgi:hypothetical protein